MIEILESRIAPAGVFYFTDTSGNHVKVTSTVGTSAQLATAVEAGLSNYNSMNPSTTPPVGVPHTLQLLTLTAPTFSGASISITATPSNDLDPGTHSAPGPVEGNGLVNVGEINASGVNLKSVTVHGDLGQIIVGGGNATSVGLGSLNVVSMGDFGLLTGANATLSRFINGVTSITVAHDVNGVLLRADEGATGSLPLAKIGSIVIGGNLIGGSTASTGEIAAADGIGSVKIFGSVIGGSAADTGRIATSVSGRLSGAAKTLGGSIGSISIGGDLVGGSANATGAIYAADLLGSVTISGSVIGGSAITSGGIDGQSIGTIKVVGDLMGTQFSSGTAVDHTAFIRSQTNIKSVYVGGSLIPGAETGGGTLTFSAAIQAGQTLQSVTVLGSIQGTATDRVIISGVGLALPTKQTQDPAIGTVSVGGSATYMQVLAGYGLTGNPASGDAQISTVKVGGDLIASDIIAGVKTQTSGADFGTSTDTMIAIPSANSSAVPPYPGVTADGVIASIASIVVGGQIEGTTSSGTFGIEAQLIRAITTGGEKLVLTQASGAGTSSFYISPTISVTSEHDVHVRDTFPLDS
jgi:hypothetical protein